MEKSIRNQKYPSLIRALHWLMSLIIIGLIAVGWYMHGLPKDDPSKYMLYPWHKSFGLLILLLWPIRALTKALARKPPYYGLTDKQTRVAAFAHFFMYVLMLMVPISGYLMSVAGGHDVEFFGMEVPALVSENETLGGLAYTLHGYLPWILLAFVGIHIAAVIRHHSKDKVNVLRRML